MTFRFVAILAVLVALLNTGPALAQPKAQGSDMSGIVQGSDVYGVTPQSDQLFFQSDEVQVRMADIAASLATALTEGTLALPAGGDAPSVAVSEALSTLLLAPSRKKERAARRQFVRTLTAAGVPAPSAKALATAAGGLLADGAFVAKQFAPALQAFNGVVATAPAPFLAAAPADFLAVRAVLVTLLDGAVD
jgi:hypothetical protein